MMRLVNGIGYALSVLMMVYLAMLLVILMALAFGAIAGQVFDLLIAFMEWAS
jgi:hypothetical protein